MIEINGWVSINFSIDGEIDMPDNIIESVSRAVSSLDGFNQSFKLLEQNGRQFLSIGICHNHNVGYSDMVFEFLTNIGKLTPGSYGVIYIRDDDFNNEFKILKMAKGQLSIEDDRLLSPCNPTIEE